MKILIVKTSSLGDIIHAFPVLDYLRRKFPKAQIDWVVEKSGADLVRSHPLVDHVFQIDTKRWRQLSQFYSHYRPIMQFFSAVRQTRYDVIFDLQGNIKSGLIMLASKSKCKVGFGYYSVRESINTVFTNLRYDPPSGLNIRRDNLFLPQSFFNDYSASSDHVTLMISEEQQALVAKVLNKLPSTAPKIMISPGSAWPNKQVSFETLKMVIELLCADPGCHFLLTHGSQQEKEVADQLHALFPEQSFIMDPMPLSSLQNLMSHMQLIIAMDSLPLHLAGTTSTPTFSFFGPSSSMKYRPLGPQHDSFQGTCPYGRSFEKRCPVLRTCPTGACIKDFNPALIAEEIRSKIAWKNH